MNMRQHTQKNW